MKYLICSHEVECDSPPMCDSITALMTRVSDFDTCKFDVFARNETHGNVKFGHLLIFIAEST